MSSSHYYPLAISPRKLAANRRNALKSTGPRTPAGKLRSSKNHLKHGLCSDSPLLPGECPATFFTFRDELRSELQPKTPLQNILADRIAHLSWRLQRIADAERHLFPAEAHKAAADGVSALHSPPDPLAGVYQPDHPTPHILARNPLTAPPCEILAARFADDSLPENAFSRLARYERSLSSQLFRLLSHYHRLQKLIPHLPHTDPPRNPKDLDVQRSDAARPLDVQRSNSSPHSLPHADSTDQRALHEELERIHQKNKARDHAHRLAEHQAQIEADFHAKPHTPSPPSAT